METIPGEGEPEGMPDPAEPEGTPGIEEWDRM